MGLADAVGKMKANMAFVKGTLFTSPVTHTQTQTQTHTRISNVFLQLESIIQGEGKTEELLLEAT